MAGAFTLELDTRPPQLTLNAPAWTVVFDDLLFTVTGDENFDTGYQDAKLVDDQGTEHPIIMVWEEGPQRWSGSLHTAHVAAGHATLSVTLRDEVANPATIEKTINVLAQAILVIDVEYTARSINVLTTERELILSQSARSVLVESQEREVSIDTLSRSMDLEVIQQ